MKFIALLIAVVVVGLILSLVLAPLRSRAAMRKGETIAEFEVHHVPGQKRLFLSLSPRDEEISPVIWFLHYMARQVNACSPDLGEHLWRELFKVSSEHWEKIHEGDLDGLEVAVPEDVWAVTTNPGEIQDSVLFHGGVFFSNGITMLDQQIPMVSNATLEHVSTQGVRALYYHLMRCGSRQTRFLLPVGVMRMCNWYQAHGWSGPMKEHGATQDAMEMVLSTVRSTQSGRQPEA